MQSIFKEIDFIIKVILVIFIISICDIDVSKNDNLEMFDFDESTSLGVIAMKNEEVKPKPIVQKNRNEEAINYYKANMTGYSADCPLCSGKLGCLSSYNVYKNGVVTYKDKTYGDVRIVASSSSIACGSIVKIDSSRYSSQPFYAIVLDRGVSGKNLDLLVANTQEAYNKVGRIKISYSVLRNGWQ